MHKVSIILIGIGTEFFHHPIPSHSAANVPFIIVDRADLAACALAQYQATVREAQCLIALEARELPVLALTPESISTLACFDQSDHPKSLCRRQDPISAFLSKRKGRHLTGFT
jgi:hypothetical protein